MLPSSCFCRNHAIVFDQDAKRILGGEGGLQQLGSMVRDLDLEAPLHAERASSPRLQLHTRSESFEANRLMMAGKCPCTLAHLLRIGFATSACPEFVTRAEPEARASVARHG